MRRGMHNLQLLIIGVLVGSLVWAAGTALSAEQPAEGSGAKVFALEEVSIWDCPEPARSRLQMGQYSNECGDSPLAGVAYPKFKSSRPIYGEVAFGMSLFDPQAGLRYCFAVDESAGTGTGYDRLYFDLDHDGDLANDPAVVRMKEVPAGMRTNLETILFERIQVNLDYGPDGVWAQPVIPRLMNLGGISRMFFVAPVARKGKIVLGSQETELVLAQGSSVAGRYDRPMTDAFLIGRDELLPFLGLWRHVDGTFYRLLPTAAGDKITVESYSGPFGTFEAGRGDREISQPKIELGWLYSRDAIIDLATCTEAGGKFTIPAGDYRPLRMAIRYGQRRVALSADTSQIGRKTARPVTFPFKVRRDEPFVLNFSGTPDVVFRSPAGERVNAGDTLKVEAVLYLPGADIMISALEDTNRKMRGIKLPDGRDFDMFESVAPTIRIANASGRTVAEGEMPFG